MTQGPENPASRREEAHSREPFPRELAAIRDEVREFSAHRDERDRTAGWQRAVADRLRTTCRRVRIEEGGESIQLGELSAGCRACKAGTWDCLFLTMSCNLSCAFCLTPCHLEGGASLSALGDDLQSVVEVSCRLGAVGVGLSGGEPLLVPNLLLECLSGFRRRQPDLYLWLYTNGLLLTEDAISGLANAGLQELRFNMAATGYHHTQVTKLLRHAVRLLPVVTVEVPAIPEDRELLLQALPLWSQLGVSHLNLHDLIYQAGTPSETLPGARRHCRMPDGHSCEVNPESAELVDEVFRRVEADKLGLAVNYCSLGSKIRQLRGRRRMLAPITLKPWEVLYGEDEAESFCFFNSTTCRFAHPEVLASRSARSGCLGVARVRRLLPLAPRGPGQWTHFELLKEVGA